MHKPPKLGCNCTAAGLWGLINNAGIGSSAHGPLEWMAVANFRECIEVNCLGVVDVTMTFLPLLKRARGRVVITTSALVRGACAPTYGPYTASKFASEGFADVLRSAIDRCSAFAYLALFCTPASWLFCATSSHFVLNCKL